MKPVPGLQGGKKTEKPEFFGCFAKSSAKTPLKENNGKFPDS